MYAAVPDFVAVPEVCLKERVQVVADIGCILRETVVAPAYGQAEPPVADGTVAHVNQVSKATPFGSTR